jgi:hypothetical protein
VAVLVLVVTFHHTCYPSGVNAFRIYNIVSEVLLLFSTLSSLDMVADSVDACL